MKKLLLLAFLILLLSGNAFGGQKYNPYNNTWETTRDNSTMKYNPYNNAWGYEQPDSTMEYNPYNNSWDYN